MLIKYSGKYVKSYFNMKITFFEKEAFATIIYRKKIPSIGLNKS